MSDWADVELVGPSVGVDSSGDLGTQHPLERTLSEAVAIATGGLTDVPRPGQALLAADIDEAMERRGHCAGEAPTGVGKSIAYLTPAVLAALRGERTVVSTESLALQSQLIDKDLPTVTAAVEETAGYKPSFAVLKGWSNYGCVHSAVAAAYEATGLPEQRGLSPLEEVRRLVAALNDAGSSPRLPLGLFTEVREGDETATARRALIAWVLTDTLNGGDADRHAYPGPMENEDWAAVSVSSSECIGVNECPFGSICRPDMARERAASADVVVTNHSMLAIQAAKNVPVVIGNTRLGPFRHVVVDEAHALPSIVRNQGAVAVSGRRIVGSLAAMRHLLDDRDPNVKRLFTEGDGFVNAVDETLESFSDGRVTASKVLELGEGDDPLADMAELVEHWVERASKMCTATRDVTRQVVVYKRRALSRLESLKADFAQVRKDQSGIARWLELDMSRGVPVVVVKASPVEVGWMLSSRVWVAPVPFDEEGESCIPEDEWIDRAAIGVGMDDATPDNEGTLAQDALYPLSVSAVSGTLPNGFPFQIGLRQAGIERYASPFDTAYGASMLFVPRASSPLDVSQLATPGSGSKVRFNTSQHPAWAKQHIASLVDANSGSALVLSSTTAAGRGYADMLRREARGRWNVLSQWDGHSTRRLVDEWRSDETSVLVGTRSLMTGVDAPGKTCSLVIVDRVPRSAFNPVDDARVKLLQEKLDMSRWDADVLVYVSDAALLLEQAAGRLIRSTSDAGMVAILDPRLLKSGPFTMSAKARGIYMDALHRFTHKTAALDEAVGFLSGLRQAS